MRHTLVIKLWQAVIILLALAAGGWQFFNHASIVSILTAALAVLLAGLPLPLIASKPLVLYRIGQRAEELGVKIARKKCLGALADATTLVVGHSGTLTSNDPYIAELIPEGISQSALLTLAASAEKDSSHPIARLIYSTAVDRHLRLQPAINFNEAPGQGVEAIISRAPIRVGNAEWLKAQDVEISAELLTRADQLALRGQLPIFVSSGKYARGLIIIEDEITMDTVSALSRLKRLGLKLMLLTGAARRLASAVKKRTNIDEVRAELSPVQKTREIQLLKARKETIAMLGDSRQDVAALKEADLSICWLEKPAHDDGSEERKIELPEEDPDFPEETPEPAAPTAATSFEADIRLPKGQLIVLARLRHRAVQGMKLVRQQRRLAMLGCCLLLVPASGVLTFFGLMPNLGLLLPLLALAGNLLLTVFILLLSLRA